MKHLFYLLFFIFPITNFAALPIQDDTVFLERTIDEEPEYCTPIFDIGCDFGDMIDNFILFGDNGTSINDVATGCSENAYDDRTDQIVDFHQGYNYSAKVVSGTNFDHNSIWIDFNDDGIFDESEKVGLQILDDSNNVEIIIPEDANTGSHRMRVMVGWHGDPNQPAELDPCNSGESATMYGEVHDYSINIIETIECTETPTAGEIDADASSNICEGVALNLTSIGATQAMGVTYQWEKRHPEEDNTWIAIDDGNQLRLNLPEGISQQTEFRLNVTCENSDLSDTSDIISVTINPENECYCIPTYTYSCSSNDQINNVTLEGESIILNNDTECSIENYGDYTELEAPDLLQGSTYTLEVSTEYVGPLVENVRVWIDYNNDGVFDTSEEIANTNGEGMGDEGIVSFDFTTLESAEPGDYRMRIRLVHEGDSDLDPCANEEYGETEDYTIEIIESMSVDDFVSYNFNYYPNPVINTLNLEAENNIDSMVLYDVLGKVHASEKPNTRSYQLNMQKLNTGIYFIKISIQNEEKAFKIIKK